MSNLEQQKRELQGICEQLGIGYQELANRLGYPEKTVYKWVKGYQKIGEHSLHRIRDLVHLKKHFAAPVKNVDRGDLMTDGPDIRKIWPGGRAPIVSYARAGDVLAGNYDDLANHIDEWVPTDCKDPNAFAVRVENDSMMGEIRPGDVLVFQPNAEAQNGNIVLARLKEEGSALVKIYHQPKPGIVRLTSYNPAYPALEFPRRNFRFIYPMYEMRRR